MGRPLKIAKGQIITITATNGTTEVVTVSENLDNLNIIAGMPFVPASTTGGLTGGTTYYILKVVSSTTFTVSATPINANPNLTPVNLTTAGPVSVKASVGLVDTGFSNPDNSATATNATSYGVVGGDTGLYGSQVLVRAAIGIAGTGTIYSSTSSTDVYGAGTDFTTDLSAGSAIQIVNQQTGIAENIGFISSVGGYLTEAVTSTTATGDFVVTSTGDFTNLTANQPVTFDANIGGLTTGTTYFVLSGANTTHMQVSAKLGGTAVDLSNQTATSNAVQDVFTLSASASANSSFNTNPMASWIYANDEASFIVRQKGKTKYLVTGATSGLTAQCFTANLANTALTPNTMNILATYADTSTKYVESVNDYQSEVFPTTVAAGSLVGGTVYTIQSVGTTNWTAVGAHANMTGITFTATGAGSGTGTAVLSTTNADVIATFGTAYAANTYDGQPNPIVTISNS